MQFATYLKSFLESKGVVVVNTLDDDDIDVILHVNPFPLFAKASSFSYLAAAWYRYRHPNTKIVHRVNECDERKGTQFMNAMLVRATAYADHTVFISQWLGDLLKKQGVATTCPSSVIRNGADSKIFFPSEQQKVHDRLTLVTHHWSAHPLKGHDVYARIDALLELNKWVRDHFSFVYIGNLPADRQYKHIEIRKPVSGKELADQLRSCDVYISASQFEPAGMHHIEGAMCGLPLLYRYSGALPEYCKDVGVGFTGPEDVEQALREIYESYGTLQQKMSTYQWTAARMANAYYDLCQNIVQTPNNRRAPLSLLFSISRDWVNDIFNKGITYVRRAS